MEPDVLDELSPVLFIPHGAGPLPLLGDKGHQDMIGFLKEITPSLGKPSAILVISAHWEAGKATITTGKTPSLLYDYYGFPDEAYEIEYPAPGAPMLAEKIFGLLQQNGIDASLDDQRGFDHGLFVPLKLMYPDANIPCVQLSLINHLEPEAHIKLGKALADLRKDNVLIIGSGFSFHNLKAFFSGNPDAMDAKNEAFEHWLIDTCTNTAITTKERRARLIDWVNAPFARYCHPREEHLLPLHVCAGLSDTAAELVFDGKVAGKRACAFLW
jgi:aromatic ring-opening dioxygenase catalytic subunit (LigB family)